MMISVVIEFADAATWYVDSAAAGAGNGTSWANAWTSISMISGVHAGDVVYISGGPAGSSRIYTLSSTWTPAGGVAGNPVTYQIAQDSAHNGTAVFRVTSPVAWIGGGPQNIIVSGQAGDGAMHFQVAPIAPAGMREPIEMGGSTNARISYCNFTQQSDGIQVDSNATQLEIDHCYLYKLNSTGNAGAFIQTTALPWDSVRLHDCEFHVPYDSVTSGFGDDCLKGNNWSGVSVYNNNIIAYGQIGYIAGEHQDGVQVLSGDHIKIYGNVFQNLSGFGVFIDGVQGNFKDVWIYNNIIAITNSAFATFNYSRQGIAIIGQGDSKVFTDIAVANNLIVDYGERTAILFNNSENTSNYVNCVCRNNISLNSGPILTEKSGNGVVLTDHNVITNSGSGFASYKMLTSIPPNDFHLTAGASQLRGQGIDLSAYFATDKDGVARTKGAWDIGPYALGNRPQTPKNFRVLSP
jgi:Right handed beta helix region